jgi:alanine racemase
MFKITHMMHFSDADGDRFGQQGIDIKLLPLKNCEGFTG